MTWTHTIERYIAEGRTVSGGKGDKTAEDTEKSQGTFTNLLQQTFATNNAQQQSQLAFLNNKLTSAINNPQGYSPETLASMRAQANDAVAAENQNVQRAVNAKQATQGGADALPSGVNAQVNAAVAAEAAQAGNRAQQDITIQDANLKNDNLWNAVKSEEGVASLEDPTGFAGAETGSAGQVGELSKAVTSAKGPGWGSILGGVVGAGLGAAGSYFGAKG